MSGHSELSSRAGIDLKFGNFPSLIVAALEVKQASARANFDAGVLPRETLTRIEFACEQLKHSVNDVHLFSANPLKGGGSIALHLNLLECLEHKSGISKEYLNAGQSTADVFHTAHRLAIYRDSAFLIDELSQLSGILERQSQNWVEIQTLSRTCLRDALTVSLGKSWSNYFSALERRKVAIENSRKQLLKINLGGTVIGSGAGANPQYLAEILNELRAITKLPVEYRENLYDAAQNSDDLAAFHGSLVLLSQVLMKLARDLRLLGSGPQGGFGELKLPRSQEASSFFKDKVNPVVPESMIQCGAWVIGADTAIQVALQHSELNLNVFEGFAGIQILSSLSYLIKEIHSFRVECIEGIQPQLDRCKELAELSHPVKMKMGVQLNDAN